ncbi:MAG: biopolymer transporter ExbD [Deltaproteobacteria bacterium]|nr:biopolymer transporter ExbD [Deltaproteobacteria bacterium]MCW5802629.1 biopolymer transporter ExbD [Deltaproteobacteria bacterium]
MAEYSAQRVRTKTRAAVRKREEDVEIEEMESGELNLIPYLDMVTNLMLFLLASVSAGIILTQIDTTLPDQAPPKDSSKDPPPDQKPDDQPLKLVVSIYDNEITLWSFSERVGTFENPEAQFKRTGKLGDVCDGPYMCESNTCDSDKRHPLNPMAGTCVLDTAEPTLQKVYDYHALNVKLVEVARRFYAGKARKQDTYAIVLMADPSIPYSAITSTMAAMRCILPKVGGEVATCAMPSDDEKLKTGEPISPDGKFYDTARAAYDPEKMALFSDIQFSPGFRGKQ